MSNNQWNNGQGQSEGDGQGQGQPQGDWNPAPQQGAGEWDQNQPPPSGNDWNAGQQAQSWNTGAQPQPSANDWNAGQQAQDWNTGAQPPPSANDWNAGQQAQSWNTGAQPPPSANDWNAGQQAQDWSTGAQPQPSANDWNASQGWNAGATAHQQQGWGDPNQQAGFAPDQHQWQPQPPKKQSAFGNVFDFSFKKFALPEAGGAIFLLAVIAIAVWWLMDLISVLTLAGGAYGLGAGSILQVLIGGLARSFLYILIVRVVIEGMSALVTRSHASATDVAEVVTKDPGTV